MEIRNVGGKREEDEEEGEGRRDVRE